MKSLYCTLFLFAVSVYSTSIDIWSTGTNNDHSLATQGTADQHWSLISTPFPGDTQAGGPYVVVDPYPFGNQATSQWISGNIHAFDGYDVGYFVYQTTFTILPGSDLSTASLTGFFSVDDNVEVFLNGQYTGVACENNGCWNFGSSFTINSGFTSGVNTLTFRTENTGGPAGLQVAITGTVSPLMTAQSICENADQSLWGYGQGYYCFNSGFVQCWGSAPWIESAFQNCPAGTACACTDLSECSSFGTLAPCRISL